MEPQSYIGTLLSHDLYPIFFQQLSIDTIICKQPQPLIYSDCVEVSLLRMLHIFLFDNSNHKKIDLQLLQSYSPHPDLLQFLTQYSDIHPDNYYRKPLGNSVITEGYKMRTEWAIVLAQRGLEGFLYGPHNFEIKATPRNFVLLFKTFFPKIELTSDMDPQTAADKIANFFSRENLLVSCVHEVADWIGNDRWTYQQNELTFSFNNIPEVKWILIQAFEYGQRASGHSWLELVTPPVTFDKSDKGWVCESCQTHNPDTSANVCFKCEQANPNFPLPGNFNEGEQ